MIEKGFINDLLAKCHTEVKALEQRIVHLKSELQQAQYSLGKLQATKAKLQTLEWTPLDTAVIQEIKKAPK